MRALTRLAPSCGSQTRCERRPCPAARGALLGGRGTGLPRTRACPCMCFTWVVVRCVVVMGGSGLVVCSPVNNGAAGTHSERTIYVHVDMQRPASNCTRRPQCSPRASSSAYAPHAPRTVKIEHDETREDPQPRQGPGKPVLHYEMGPRSGHRDVTCPPSWQQPSSPEGAK